LGYRGVLFFKGNDYYHVFNGNIRYALEGESVIKEDAGRVLEKSILQTAPEAVQKLVAGNFR
jgi:hypothetical protein